MYNNAYTHSDQNTYTCRFVHREMIVIMVLCRAMSALRADIAAGQERSRVDSEKTKTEMQEQMLLLVRQRPSSSSSSSVASLDDSSPERLHHYGSSDDSIDDGFMALTSPGPAATHFANTQRTTADHTGDGTVTSYTFTHFYLCIELKLATTA
jgi:hypothetical protein